MNLHIVISVLTVALLAGCSETGTAPSLDSMQIENVDAENANSEDQVSSEEAVKQPASDSADASKNDTYEPEQVTQEISNADGTDTSLSAYYVKPGVLANHILSKDENAVVGFIHVEYSLYEGYKKQLFSDTASFYEIESYQINMRHLIEFQRDEDQLTITNWVPRDLHGVTVMAEYQGIKYKVMTIDELPGSQRFVINTPWTLGLVKFQSSKGEVLDFTTVETADITLSILAQDAVQRSITSIGLNWNVSFPDRVMGGKADVCRAGNVVWRPTRPQDARYLLTFMIHAAQTVSHPKFYEFWLKTAFNSSVGNVPQEYLLSAEEFENYSEKEKIMYRQENLDAGNYFNKAHRKMVFERYFEKTFQLGMTGGGGLGGGSTVGVNHNKIIEQAWAYSQTAADAFERNEWYMPEGDTTLKSTAWNIFGHETGHALGFSHKENYTVREVQSHIAVGTIVNSWLVLNDKTIITKDTMVGRDLNWEASYKKKLPAGERSRPRCGEAFEWGGAYPRQNILLPIKGSDEWHAYLEQHRIGNGLPYLLSLPDSAFPEDKWAYIEKIDD